MNNKVNKLCIFGILLTFCWLLPLLGGNIPLVGNMLCLMHIPVIFAGFILGPWYGLALGLIAPITRSTIFGAPVMYPFAICMSLELATYGLVCGLLYKILLKTKIKHEIICIYIALISAQLLGRCIWGTSRLIFGLVPGATSFTWKIFLVSGFVNAWPGILLQLVAIPYLVLLARKNYFIRSLQPKDKSKNINLNQSSNVGK